MAGDNEEVLVYVFLSVSICLVVRGSLARAHPPCSGVCVADSDTIQRLADYSSSTPPPFHRPPLCSV